jgi:hypothetical protein
VQLNGHDYLDFWPVALVAGTGLIAWGRLSHKVDAVKEAIAEKASTERVDALDSKLGSIDAKMDRVLDHLLNQRNAGG